jgi:hypothetical protein
MREYACFATASLVRNIVSISASLNPISCWSLNVNASHSQPSGSSPSVQGVSGLITSFSMWGNSVVINVKLGVNARVPVMYHGLGIRLQVWDARGAEPHQAVLMANDSLWIATAAGRLLQRTYRVWVGRNESPSEVVRELPY